MAAQTAARPARPRGHVGPIPLLAGVIGASMVGLLGAIAIVVCLAVIFTSAGATTVGQAPSGSAPSQKPLDPGTYHAGNLTAPAKLGGLHRLVVTQQAQVQLLRNGRDALRQATGKPAIAAAYGRQTSFELLPVVLQASSGYVDPRQLLGTVASGKVAQTTVGPDVCAAYTGLAVVCVRSDQQKHLTVVVEGSEPYLASPQAAAALVDDGWKELGG